MTANQRRRSAGLCAALAVAGWVGGSCPAWAVSGADPGTAPAGLETVESLEGRVQELCDDHDDQAASPIELRQIQSEFIDLLEGQPEEPRLLADLAGFYQRWAYVLKTASPAALRLVTRAADPVRMPWLLHRGAGDLGADLLFAALTEKPDTPDIWLEAANNSKNPAWRIVATEEGARLLPR